MYVHCTQAITHPDHHRILQLKIQLDVTPIEEGHEEDVAFYNLKTDVGHPAVRSGYVFPELIRLLFAVDLEKALASMGPGLEKTKVIALLKYFKVNTFDIYDALYMASSQKSTIEVTLEALKILISVSENSERLSFLCLSCPSLKQSKSVDLTELMAVFGLRNSQDGSLVPFQLPICVPLL